MKHITSGPCQRIEIVASRLPEPTEAVREERTRHIANIKDEVDPEDDMDMMR